jgi:hypothetical protein
LNDNTKGYSNQGSGRVQYLHAFDKTKISSTYKDESSSTGFRNPKERSSKNNFKIICPFFVFPNSLSKILMDSKELVRASNIGCKGDSDFLIFGIVH